jgi:hypothetical protein
MSAGRTRDLLIAAALAAATYLLYQTLLGGLRESLGNFSKYPLAAQQFAAGELTVERAQDFSPLYLRLVIWVNAHATDPFLALLRIQCGCVAAAGGAVYLALRRHAGTWVALFGAAALALYPGLIAHAFVFEPEPLMVLWLALLLLFAGGRSTAALAAAGVTLALCVLTRPGFWPLLVVVPAACALCPAGKSALRAAGVFLGAFLIAWTAFSFALAPAPPALSTMNPGTVFYDGTNPLSEGVRAEYPELVVALSDDFPGTSDYQHALYRLLARRSERRELTRGEANAWWAAKGLAYAADHPGLWVASVARKVYFALHAHRWHDLRVAWLADRQISGRTLPLVTAAPIAALALAGLVLWRDNWRAGLLAYAGFALQLFTIAATYASERQRLSLWPFLCFFAALGLGQLVRRRAGLTPALATALLAIPLSLDNGLTRDDRATMAGSCALPDALARTLELRTQGRLPEAAEACAGAMALAPWAFHGGLRPERLPGTGTALAVRAEELLRASGVDTPTTRLHRGLLLLAAGRIDAAEALFSGLKAEHALLLRRQQRVVDPDYWLALIARRRGDERRAIGLLLDALERRPGDPQVLGALAVLTAEATYATALGRYFDAADADYYIGVSALEFGNGALAAQRLQEAATLLPEARDLKVALAAGLFSAERPAEASEAYLAAMKLRPEPLLWEEPILGGLGRRADQAPPGDFARYLHGRALRQFGRFAEAKAELTSVLAATGRPAVAEELNALDADIAALRL